MRKKEVKRKKWVGGGGGGCTGQYVASCFETIATAFYDI